MRIASVSDLHIDFAENRRALVQLATEIHRGQADVVIIAGDVSHVDAHITAALRAFKLAAPTVVYLPGNHDLWIHVDETDSVVRDTWDRYRNTLKHLVEDEGGHYLPSGRLQLGSSAIVGTTGWYDYSFVRPEHREVLTPSKLAAKQWAGMGWTDARFIAFKDAAGELMTDTAVARVMEDELQVQLKEADNDPGIQDILVATHVVPFAQSLGPAKGLPWDYFDAFMGSTRLGELIQSSPKVRAAVYGHTHRPQRLTIGRVEVFGTPLGYPRDRKKIDPSTLGEHAVGWVELPNSATH